MIGCLSVCLKGQLIHRIVTWSPISIRRLWVGFVKVIVFSLLVHVCILLEGERKRSTHKRLSLQWQWKAPAVSQAALSWRRLETSCAWCNWLCASCVCLPSCLSAGMIARALSHWTNSMEHGAIVLQQSPLPGFRESFIGSEGPPELWIWSLCSCPLEWRSSRVSVYRFWL